MAFDREQIKKKVAALAAKGVFIGTSSWKYEGWLDRFYTPDRYEKQKQGANKKAEDAWFPGLAVEAAPTETQKS